VYNVKKAISNKRIGKDDVYVLLISCHGGQKNGNQYFVLSDEKTIWYSDLKKMIGKVGGRFQFCVYDVCSVEVSHASNSMVGLSGGFTSTLSERDNTSLRKGLTKLFKKYDGNITIFASQDGHYAFTSPMGGYMHLSLFQYAMVNVKSNSTWDNVIDDTIDGTERMFKESFNNNYLDNMKDSLRKINQNTQSPRVTNKAELIGSNSLSYNESWKTATTFPEEYVNYHWDYKHYIEEVAYGDGEWKVVMKKSNNKKAQTWATRNEFPHNYIYRYWNKGYTISDIAYGEGMWCVVLTKYSKSYAQAWAYNTYFPDDFIEEYWNKEYLISKVAYGGGIWCVIMTEDFNDRSQTWAIRNYYPEDYIEDLWNDGYLITDIVFGDGVWCVIMTEDIQNKQQRWVTRNYYPEDYISSYWDKGFRITSITYANGIWCLVMTKPD
jgi:hypothetical protein